MPTKSRVKYDSEPKTFHRIFLSTYTYILWRTYSALFLDIYHFVARLNLVHIALTFIPPKSLYHGVPVNITF